jgi:uncharacterized membrane protein HdeD (DUF308 family)
MDEVEIIEADFTPLAWWIFLLQGLIAIIFGAAAILWAPLIVDLIAFFIGALIIIYSISTIIKGLAGQDKGTSRILLIILGIIGIIIGVLAIMNLAVLWVTIAVLIALWAFITGFGDLWIGLTAERENGWYRALLVISGIIALMLGIMMMVFPMAGTAVIVQVLGIFALAMGIVSLITGFIIQAKIKG